MSKTSYIYNPNDYPEASRPRMSSQKRRPAKAIRPTTELRIISGRYRGRTLKTPNLSGTHPMGARERLALFNMVNVESAKVLDAYAGTGALGLEALSRGASEVTFVEKSRPAARIIQENLQILSAKGDVIVSSVTNFAQEAAKDSARQGYFDVIFADPPYDNFQPRDIAAFIPLLSPDGVLVLSSPASLNPPEYAGLRISSTHTYARARLTVYRRA